MKGGIWALDISWIANMYFNTSSDRNGTVRGFSYLLNLIERKYSPSHIIACQDFGSNTFRHKLYPKYKGNRDEKKAGFLIQLEQVYALINSLGIQVLEDEEYEADDFMASLACQFADNKVVLVSKDKDLKQVLKDGKVGMFFRQNGGWNFYSRKMAEKDWGVPSEHFITYQVLIGDSADNIPGCSGIGPKRARALIEKYGGLEDILRHASKESPTIAKKLTAFDPELTKRLITLKTDIPIVLKPAEIDGAALIKVCEKNEIVNHWSEK